MIMQDRVRANEKIDIVWNTEVIEIHGSVETGVESVTLYNNQKGETSIFPTQGVFIAIGHAPNTDLFKGVLDMDEVGYLITEGRSMKTKVEGVFACGDAQDSYYRQAVTAAGTGCMAAIDAERFLAEHGSDTATTAAVAVES
jgi:thioredoxin reductase (NADPH)